MKEFSKTFYYKITQLNVHKNIIEIILKLEIDILL